MFQKGQSLLYESNYPSTILSNKEITVVLRDRIPEVLESHNRLMAIELT